MARLNRRSEWTGRTHEGAPSSPQTAEQQLRRRVLTCLLWEDNFYESGVDVAKGIVELAQRVNPQTVAEIADEARNEHWLRHVPLLLIVAVAKRGGYGSIVREMVNRCVRRPDEMGELLAIYEAMNGGEVRPIANAIKRGLRDVFPYFNEYQLAKWDRDYRFKLRDVMFLVHPCPVDDEQEQLWDRLIEGKLPTPDTWEVAMSNRVKEKFISALGEILGDATGLSPEDAEEMYKEFKKGTRQKIRDIQLSELHREIKRGEWERLLKNRKLGDMATIMNLRNMMDVGVDRDLIQERLSGGLPRVFPFRFLTAARMVPELEPELDKSMIESIRQQEQLSGSTAILVDVSGSMDRTLSQRGTTTRIDAAAGLAVLVRDACEGHVDVFSFSNQTRCIPARHGMALRDAIMKDFGGGTYLGQAVKDVSEQSNAERFIVITDEQSHDPVPDNPPFSKSYIINVAPYEHGVVQQGGWERINGWSSGIHKYIREIEKVEN